MGCNPAQNVRFGVVWLYSPHSFSECAGPDPDLMVMHILIAELAPEADLCPQHLVLALVVFDHLADVHVVEVHPGLVGAVGHAQVVAHSHVQVKRTVF